MDSLKGIGKGGWHTGGSKTSETSSSSGDKKSFTGLGVRGKLSDAKGRATGRDVESLKHRETALNHQSRPLASLKDPASFAPPPKHSAYYGAGGQSLIEGSSVGSSTAVVRTTEPERTGGWGAPAVENGYAQRKAAERREAEEQAELEAERERERRREVGYLKDTSGLRTDNLPKPPVRRIATEESASGPAVSGRRQSPALPGRGQSPALPARQNSPALPARQNSPALPPRRTGAPPPSLPPRQNEYPDEHTPAPPPAYQDALKSPAVQQAAAQTYQNNSGAISQFAANRLGQAGVSVPGFGIGGGSSNSNGKEQPRPAGHGPQLGELQQRFSRMGTGTSNSNSSAIPGLQTQQTGSVAEVAAQKKPPPLPPKKAGLSSSGGGGSSNSSGVGPAPPPLPLSSKPKPPM